MDKDRFKLTNEAIIKIAKDRENPERDTAIRILSMSTDDRLKLYSCIGHAITAALPTGNHLE